jgi:hypothetical protein
MFGLVVLLLLEGDIEVFVGVFGIGCEKFGLFFGFLEVEVETGV